MAFIQIIEVNTTAVDEIQALMDQWVAKTEGKRKTQRSTLTPDQDRPHTYIQIVEFPSFEEATANSPLPETTEFAERLTTLCDRPPVFRNLEVRRVDTAQRLGIGVRRTKSRLHRARRALAADLAKTELRRSA